jgi:phosphoribosylanthranilate isomerase
MVVTRVMICGSRDEADIELLVRAGVEAIGLITEVRQAIPCNLSREQARALAARVPPLVAAVLIITAERVEEACRLVEYVHPDAVQLHGFNRPEDVVALKERLGVRVIKALHLQGERVLEGDDPERCALNYLDAGADAILLDSYHEGKVGATGQAVDFTLGRRLRDAIWPQPLILAGGLSAANVAEAVQRVQPFAVDVFTGVTHQGRLQPQKIREFMHAVQSCRRTWPHP